MTTSAVCSMLLASSLLISAANGQLTLQNELVEKLSQSESNFLPLSYTDAFRRTLDSVSKLSNSKLEFATEKVPESKRNVSIHHAMNKIQSAFTDPSMPQKLSLAAEQFGKSRRKSPPPVGLSDSEKCADDFGKMVAAMTPEDEWGLQMLDAWGKPGAGLTQASATFFGMYDQCLDTKVKGADFVPQYCYQMVGFTQIGSFSFKKPLGFLLGTCVPSSCTANDTRDIINLYLMSQPNITGGSGGGKCYDPDLPLSDKAKAVIVVCSIFAALMAFATIYDILVVHDHWRLLMPSRYPEHSYGLSMGQDSMEESSRDGGAEKMRGEYEPLLNSPVTKREFQPNLAEKTLLCFSVYTNGAKVLSTKTGAGSIDCIHGIRFLSMSWVVLGHSFVMGSSVMKNTYVYIEEAYDRWTFQAILNALVSVDTFFTLSGLLMTYLVLKELTKKPPTGAFFLNFYFHRFWRLTPPYMLVLMVYVTLFHYVGDGPFWPQESVEPDECESNWWANLLYINNLHNFGGKGECMGWSWYLANDMQFYIISPAIFLVMFYFGWIGVLLPVLLMLGNAIASGVISSHYNLEPNMDITQPQGSQGDYFDVYYQKPYCRIGPYLVGMITGYIMYRTECKVYMSKIVVVLGWAMAWAVGLSVVYGLYENTHGHPVSTDVAALYNALNRIAWGAAVCWVIFACATGYGGFINTILSWKAFVPLSRLTYCAYLVHILVLYYFFFSQREFFYLDNTDVVYTFLGSLVLAMMLAFVASMAFEAPFMGLEKILIQGIKSGVSKIRDNRGYNI